MKTNCMRIIAVALLIVGTLGGESGRLPTGFPVRSSQRLINPRPTPVQVVKVPYWRPVWARVTAYSPFDELDAGYRATKGHDLWKTSKGVDVRAQPYGVAADPRIVPYGTAVRVPGYMDETYPQTAWAVDDTGGKLRQQWTKGVIAIDIRYWTSYSVNKWGVSWQYVQLLINPGSELEHQLEIYDRRFGRRAAFVL